MIIQKHRTKIIWSLNSRDLSETLAKELSEKEDIGALRINYHPKDLENILSFIPLVHEFRGPSQEKIPVMIDVGSIPRGRLSMNEPKDLIYGEELSCSKPGKGGDIEINTEEWDSLFAPDQQVFLGFGSAILRTLRTEGDLVVHKVIHGGTLTDGMEVFVPSTRKIPSVLDLSYIDIKPFIKLGIDYVLLPGVTSAREISVVRKKLSGGNTPAPWLIVRVDSQDICEKLGDLITEADGVLISRRELSLTTDPAAVPMVCKEVIRTCNENAKLVFIASDTLASMQVNPTPTRAEVSDIANAVIDGTDAVVISEEVVSGEYRDRAISVCDKIIEDVEEHASVEVNWKKEALAINNEFDAVAYHAYKTAERVRAKAIVCITKEGNTALRLASFRTQLPVIAVTFSEQIRRRLTLVRGVHALALDVNPNLDEVLPLVNDHLKKESWLNKGDLIVFVTVSLSPMAHDASNLFTIQKLD